MKNKSKKSQVKLSDALIQKGQEQHEKGFLDRAEFSYQLAFELTPNNPDLLHALGILNIQNGSYQQAKSYLAKASVKNNRNALIWKDLSISYYHLRRFGEAEAACRKAMQLEPNNLSAIYNLALILKGREKHFEALGLLRQLATTSNTDIEFLAEYAETVSICNHLNDQQQQNSISQIRAG